MHCRLLMRLASGRIDRFAVSVELDTFVDLHRRDLDVDLWHVENVVSSHECGGCPGPMGVLTIQDHDADAGLTR